MAHDVFISYSTKDKPIADAACATLESKGIRCWIAPRDVSLGKNWDEAIIDAIDESRMMILVFSSNANESQEIKREIVLAVNKGVTIIPMRIEDVTPAKSLAYYITSIHWLDALTPPIENHLQQLAEKVKLLLSPFSAPPDPQDQYRTAVEVVWTDKKSDVAEGVERATAVADKLGLTREQAADVEREIIGDTKENVLNRQEAQGGGTDTRKKGEKVTEPEVKTKLIFCRKCGGNLDPGARFCKKCGEKLTVSTGQSEKADNYGVEPKLTFCRKCGGSLNPGARFCKKCGEKLT